MSWHEFPPNTQVRCPQCNHRIADTSASAYARVKVTSSAPTEDGVLHVKCKCRKYVVLGLSTGEQAA